MSIFLSIFLYIRLVIGVEKWRHPLEKITLKLKPIPTEPIAFYRVSSSLFVLNFISNRFLIVLLN